MRFGWLGLLLMAVLHASAAGSESLPDSIQATLSGAAPAETSLWDLPRWREPLHALYAAREFSPLWFREGQLTVSGMGLLSELLGVGSRGLIASDYDGESLARRVAALPADAMSTPARVAIDLQLSVAAARLASDLHRGRVRPAEVGYELDVPQQPFDVAAAVSRLSAATDVRAALDGLEPSLRHYELLKRALATYQTLARRPGLAQLPPLPGASVRPGEHYEGAPALRVLLTALGDLPDVPLPGGTEGTLEMDAPLVAALVRFQLRHGLDADGVLGRETFRALTVPLPTRLQQIVLSLERVRWLPKLDSPPLIVNVPQFRLFAFRTTQDFAADILQMDVIVGAAFEGRRTPVFAADMRYVVLNPYWDVPRSILLKELLPAIRRDPGWVDARGFEIVRGAGDDATPVPATAQNVQALAEGKLRLRQKPGPENSLGRVKFMFPNRHNVYLHDTPARELFSRSRRAFSHGCIRVADPMSLLSHVLRDDPRWNAERVTEAMRSGAPVRIPLARPIRVYILYGTALATEAGDTLFFDDLYGQDARLASLINSRRANAR